MTATNGNGSAPLSELDQVHIQAQFAALAAQRDAALKSEISLSAQVAVLQAQLKKAQEESPALRAAAQSPTADTAAPEAPALNLARRCEMGATKDKALPDANVSAKVAPLADPTSNGVAAHMSTPTLSPIEQLIAAAWTEAERIAELVPTEAVDSAARLLEAEAAHWRQLGEHANAEYRKCK